MLDFIAGFFTAALSATGVGGGGLLVLYLRLVKGTEQVEAQGLNLAFFAVSSLCAGIVHFFRRTLNFRLILFIGIIGFFGSVFGQFLVTVTDTALLSKGFGVLMAFCGVKTLIASVQKKEKNESGAKKSLS